MDDEKYVKGKPCKYCVGAPFFKKSTFDARLKSAAHDQKKSMSALRQARRIATEAEMEATESPDIRNVQTQNQRTDAVVRRLHELIRGREEERADLPDDPYNYDTLGDPDDYVDGSERTDSEEDIDIDENTAMAEEENAEFLQPDAEEVDDADDEHESERAEVPRGDDQPFVFAEQLKPPEGKPWHPFASEKEAIVYMWCYKRERPLSLATIGEVLFLLTTLLKVPGMPSAIFYCDITRSN
jgi:hypothetical protein